MEREIHPKKEIKKKQKKRDYLIPIDMLPKKSLSHLHLGPSLNVITCPFPFLTPLSFPTLPLIFNFFLDFSSSCTFALLFIAKLNININYLLPL